MSGEAFPFYKKYSLTLKAKKITLTGTLLGNFESHMSCSCDVLIH